jgi:hypothetical protein
MTALSSTSPFVPAELRALTRWVPWDLKPGKDGRPTKVPRGSTTDPKTWQTFDDALAVGADGVGFVFTDTDYSGVDLDGCLVDGRPTAEARQLIDGLASYTETSPSGAGLHIIVKGKLPPGAGHKNVHVPGLKALEAYDTGRYFTWTGQVFEGRDQIEPHAEQLAALATQWLGKASEVRPLTALEAQARLPILNQHLSNDELLALIEQEQPTKYRHFLEGELEQPRADRSQDDVTLLRLLISYTGWDEPRILALAERSSLKRDRWTKVHTQGLTWLAYQIRRELRGAAAKATASASVGMSRPIRARTLREVWADPDARTAPEAVIPRLAWRGRLTVYTALDKGGKSTLVAAGVAATTRGDNFLGEPTTRGTCMWAMLEEHVNDWAIRATRFGTDQDAVHVLEHPSDPAGAIRAEAERLRPAVLVVDVLTRYAGDRVTESGSAAQWTAVMVGLQQIARELNVAVIVLHHARKSDGVARDSGEITARADVVLEQKTLPEDGVQRFAVRGRWTLADFAVKLVGDRHELTAAGTGESTLSPQRRKVLAALKPGMTYTVWLDASGVPKRTFADTVRWLLEHMLVEHGEDGTYSLPRF